MLQGVLGSAWDYRCWHLRNRSRSLSCTQVTRSLVGGPPKKKGDDEDEDEDNPKPKGKGVEKEHQVRSRKVSGCVF